MAPLPLLLASAVFGVVGGAAADSAAAATAATAGTAGPQPLPGLKRVIVLARHGNRAPNPQIDMLCPNYAKEVMPGFKVAPAALSRVGMSENEENGAFIRHRYRDFLPPGPYKYGGTYAFFSERAERNIVSTQSFARGMFPPETGLAGFSKGRPNMVPIATTQDGADMLMNCPRDGPCQAALAHDVAVWTEKNQHRVYDENKELFAKVSAACGYDMLPGQIVFQGKSKPITWAAKAVNDAFTFALNEGLDATMGGRLSLETIKQFQHTVEGIVKDTNFGKPHQMTYWAGDFIPTVLSLARMPLVDPVNKFHLFLNHRELVYSVANLWGIPIEFPGVPAGTVPSGSSLLMEVYDSGIKLFFWMPSRPSHETKARYLQDERPMEELYGPDAGLGTLIPVAPQGCNANEPCPVEQLALSFVSFVQRTGTYVDICNVSLEDTYFSRGEASLNTMEQWVQPVLRAEETRLAASAAAREELAALLPRVRRSRPAPQDGAASSGSFTLTAAVAALVTAAGSLGYLLGQASSRRPEGPGYVSLA